MTSHEIEVEGPPTLADSILAELGRKPGAKAVDLATTLGVERRVINRCLTSELTGKVTQDSEYRWRIHTQGIPVQKTESSPAKALTEIGRLGRYYLECIGQDSDEGVNAFASSLYGEPDYAELPALPLAGTDWDWWNTPGVQRIVGKVKADKANLIAWLGYPVRLRRHRTAKWEGYFVEPVMLWQIELPEYGEDALRLIDGLPTPNFAFLRSLGMGDPSAVVEEAARLDNSLGLNLPVEDQPEVDELLQRLAAVRPDWDWLEEIDPERCSAGEPLAKFTQAGIYNRAIVLSGKRSPYTQGLEAELKQVSEMSDSELGDTALGRWLSGDFTAPAGATDDPLIEVLPMNSEQRAAVRSALSESITVVTGPPGTGKSQVVTNLLANAAWRGMKVLFASKNNKAVDVVEARVNGLGNRPVLLRLGSKEYQGKLSSYLTAMLSGAISGDDETNYQEGLERHRQLAARLKNLDAVQQRTLSARNQADQLSAQVDEYRVLFGQERFNTLDGKVLETAIISIQAFLPAVDKLDVSGKGLFGKAVGGLLKNSRLANLTRECAKVMPIARHLGATLPDVGLNPDLDLMREAARTISIRLSAATKIIAYQRALEVLRASPSFEDIAEQHQDLTEQIARNSIGLWRNWVQMTPSRLTPAQRKDVADYAAVLQLLSGPDSHLVNGSIRAKAKALQQRVTALFSCWAVTSLSARGKIPFVPGYFDLVVIDEASQCDIASALPLLFRAKRAVIIGDPMQLRHISSVTKKKEIELQKKYGLLDSRASWMYSVNSLYDVAASVASASDIVNLLDHHRSHGDIIEFSNHHFYNGNLRVATRYAQLKRPSNKGPGVIWQDVKGRTIRAVGGGISNPKEVEAVIEALHDLLVVRKYEGTVGVVTPFRAQAQLIQKSVADSSELSGVALKAQLLVDTVHKFQGDERDVMMFSPVISDETPAGALSFLRSNGNLFNVAITRARGLLHVVGSLTAARNCDVTYLADFAAYASKLTAQSPVAKDRAETPLTAEYPAVAKPEQVSSWEIVLYKTLYQAGIRAIPQFSVEQYDLDFALIVGDRRLNIEVDGEKYHRSWTGELCLRDQLRNQRLIELGWEVKRFWVYEIRDRLPECVQAVKDWQAAAEADSPIRTQVTKPGCSEVAIAPAE